MTRVVVVFGPELPGRDLLVRALERGLPADVRLVVDALPTRAERRAMMRALSAAGAKPVFVAREISEIEGRDEVFHHFASAPRRFLQLRWLAFLRDAVTREPAGDEVEPLVVVVAGEPFSDVVAQVRELLGAPETAPPPPAMTHVLVVDDDRVQRELLADALGALGCNVSTAASADEAIEIADRTPVDLVITDYMMPGGSGAALAAALTALHPGLRVAIVTGHAHDAVDALLKEAPVDVVLAKPVGVNDLLRVVDEMSRLPPRR
jgi:CheY-like chemotaxis protein